MFDLSYELNTRIHEIDESIKSLNYLSGVSGHVVSVSVLKSAVLLALYNTMEGVSRMGLFNLHDFYSRIEYDKLHDSIKKMVYKYQTHEKHGIKEVDLVNIIRSHQFKLPDFQSFEAKIQVFSGNVDARFLNDTLKKYNCPVLTESKKNKLLEIKTYRNQLAHGERTFKEIGRALVIDDLVYYRDAVFDTLNEFLSIIDSQVGS